MNLNQVFARAATRCSHLMGSPWIFLAACSLVVVWAAAGPAFDYSDTWELVINTSTTIITFLMVFLIQNTQNRDAKALHLKLDELIFSIKAASNDMLDIESLSSEDLEKIALHYRQVKGDLHPTSPHGSKTSSKT